MAAAALSRAAAVARAAAPAPAPARGRGARGAARRARGRCAAGGEQGKALSAKDLLGDDEPAKPQKPDESFMVVGADDFECRSCQYVYDPEKGDAVSGIAVGVKFQDLPEDYCCPTCGAGKLQFSSKGKVIAGFSQNQQYGFGGNSLDGGQKNLLIWSSFAVFFLLFMSGYLFH